MFVRKPLKRANSIFSLSFLLLATQSLSARGETISEFLRAFHKDPATMMERLPSIVDEHGVAHPRGFIDYDRVEAMLPARLAVRDKIMSQAANKVQSAIPDPSKDNVESLVDEGTPIERNLLALQEQKFMNNTAPIKPWADSYWPTYLGQTGYRYAGGGSSSKDWKANYAHFLSNPPSNVPTHMLSPAEKYDYAVGDTSYSLTRYAWNVGERSLVNGVVPTWMGICHGWSAAATMGAPFIEKPVTVFATNGMPVVFYPQDIKALQTMLWANGDPDSKFIGTRCEVSRPAKNANGRTINSECFDTNPATWHLSVTNQLGRNRRSFVIDGTFDAEVWNFPLLNVRYRYFNPMTFEEKNDSRGAVIPLSKYRSDKFKEFRTPGAESVVGIYMDVTYVIEIEPGTKRVYDAPTKTVRYIYDLELDAGGNIIGGEWYSNAHPDFLWTFPPGAQAMYVNESPLLMENWTNDGPVPTHWTEFARKASNRGIPLHSFVKKVVDAAGPVHQK